MIKVLVYALTERLGGIENFLINYNQEFDQISMDFISISANITYWDKLNKGNNHLYYLPRRKDGFKKRISVLKEILQKKKYDVFWYNGNDLGDIRILKTVKRSGIKTVICHAHNSSADKYYRNVLHLIHRKRIDKLVTHKFACSKLAAEWFYGNYRDVQLIYNAIDIKKYKYSESLRNEIRKKWEIPENAQVIGNVGRLCLQKNQKFLIDVFREYHKRNPNSVLIILGEGELRKKLSQQLHDYHLEDHSLMPGQVLDVIPYLMAFDVILMPSFFEGLPVTLVEAQAAGLNCVVSKAITDEVSITENIVYLSISEGIEAWLKNIRSSKDREEVNQSLEKSSFNIKTSAMKLQDYLLKEVKKTNADSFV